jgi:competence protein ComEC
MRELRTPFIAGIVTLFFLAFISFAPLDVLHGGEPVLEVSFLDIGQGDAIFITSPGGTQVLIDGGKGSEILGALGDAMGFFDRTIDMVLATHPDQDHIGGLVDVLKRYEVTTIVMTENVNNTPAFEAFQSAVENEGAHVLYARRGQIYDLGKGTQGSTTLTVLFPDHDPTELESNMSSIVARLVYGESEYLLTGDSPKEIEEYLVSIGTELTSDVLKVGHHGSRTSTAETFVSVVAPQYAVISAGKDNSYGHPHKEVVEILQRHDIVQKSTAEEGTIKTFSDGKTIWFD